MQIVYISQPGEDGSDVFGLFLDEFFIIVLYAIARVSWTVSQKLQNYCKIDFNCTICLADVLWTYVNHNLI